MPKGPQGQKRPADTVANAIRVANLLMPENMARPVSGCKGAQAYRPSN
jgi:hypothetical protein